MGFSEWQVAKATCVKLYCLCQTLLFCVRLYCFVSNIIVCPQKQLANSLLCG